MNDEEIKQLQRQVSKLQLEAKLRKSVANELERQKKSCTKSQRRGGGTASNTARGITTII